MPMDTKGDALSESGKRFSLDEKVIWLIHTSLVSDHGVNSLKINRLVS